MYDFYVGVPFTNVENFIAEEYHIATREDEAVGIAVGAVMAGKKPLVFMQDSGFGNCVDIISSLLIPYKIDVDLLVNRRHTPEHHKVMGEACPKIAEVLGYEKINYC